MNLCIQQDKLRSLQTYKVLADAAAYFPTSVSYSSKIFIEYLLWWTILSKSYDLQLRCKLSFRMVAYIVAYITKAVTYTSDIFIKYFDSVADVIKNYTLNKASSKISCGVNCDVVSWLMCQLILPHRQVSSIKSLLNIYLQ